MNVRLLLMDALARFQNEFTTEIAPHTILDLKKDTDYPLEKLIRNSLSNG